MTNAWTSTRCGALLLGLASASLMAQEQPAAQDAPAQATPKVQGTELKAVEIRANRETEERRQATAAKIVIGREEIERYGDSTLGELFKRLPGVTVGGRPGQGGAPRMRGLGSGYTQILIDGERAPRGFSTDDIAPEQVERIEILRAPTAETGARAVGGTINIITRGGYTKTLNNLTVGASQENRHTSPGASWSRNDTVDGVNYNVSVAVAHSERNSDQQKSTLSDNLVTNTQVHQMEATSSSSQRDMLHANARLQWNGAGGDTFTLMPMVIATQRKGQSSSVLTQTDSLAPYDSSAGTSESSYTSLRLAGSWAHKMDDGGRWLLNSSLGRSQWRNEAWQTYRGGNNLSPTDTQSDQHDTTWNNTVNTPNRLPTNTALSAAWSLSPTSATRRPAPCATASRRSPTLTATCWPAACVQLCMHKTNGKLTRIGRRMRVSAGKAFAHAVARAPGRTKWATTARCSRRSCTPCGGPTWPSKTSGVPA